MEITSEEMREFQKILFRSRGTLFSHIHKVEGISIEELSPEAEQLILSEPQLVDEEVLSSEGLHFGWELRKGALFVDMTPDSPYQTTLETIWSLIYRSISKVTGVGPYVVQIPNFEIRQIDGKRTLHREGWLEIIRNGEVNSRGAVLLHWLNELGELPIGGEKFLELIISYLPEHYEKRWLHDME